MSLKKKSNKKNSNQQRLAASGGDSVIKGSGTSLPEGSRTRLLELFSLIEKEFETLHAENTALHEKVDSLTERLELVMSERTTTIESSHPVLTSSTGSTPSVLLPTTELHSTTPLRKIKTSGTTITKKLMPGSKKASTNLKQLSPECSYICSYYGHKDGVWHVSSSTNGQAIIGSASADNTACLWDINSSTLLLKYTGHTGSVNCITFHPNDPLACTASGDGSAHIWKSSVNSTDRQYTKHDSSGEDKSALSDEETLDVSSCDVTSILKTPLLVLGEHTGPVMACDWMYEGNQLVTASWDHTARLWDAQTGSTIHTLRGHDEELTHICTHPTQNLVVTSSRDTTFRLWDFRAPPIHSVNVFQGHSKAVSSAVFSLEDNVISASDDHTVKIWDLQNMRYPVASIRLDCGINRIAVSHNHHVLAVPLDNRHIRLYDLGGNRIANLPHRNRKEHVRMVHSVCWSHDSPSSSPGQSNLFSGGFDARIIGWRVQY